MTAQTKTLENTRTAESLMIVVGLASLVAPTIVFKKAKIRAILSLAAAAVIPAIFPPQSLVLGFFLIITSILAYAAKPKEAT